MRHDRTTGQNLVLTAGLIAVGGTLVGMSLILGFGILVGKMIKAADIADGMDPDVPDHPKDDLTALLGVVPPPREPEPAA